MKTADLVDAHDADLRLCQLPFLKLGRKTAFSGEAFTLSCFEDNALLKAELEKPGRGRVMVVDGGASPRVALVGDQIVAIMRDSGWAGIVINGSVRDSADIDSMEVGVFCLGTTPKRSGKMGWGRCGEAVSFGGVTIATGDHVYCDRDGVLVSANRLAVD